MADLKIGIIGIGNMGSAHVSCIISGVTRGLRLMASAQTIEPGGRCSGKEKGGCYDTI